MSDDKLPAMAFKSEAGDATRRTAQRVESEQAGRPTATTTRTVGVYERPSGRARLPLPLLLIVILAALVSVIVTIRFLF
jgi:hypothetical protein